jgi:hypothetical protein
MTRVTKPNRSLRTVLALACLTVALVLPGQASAQTTVINGQKCTPTEAQYRTPSVLNCEPITTGGGGGFNSFGPLPFTGLDLISLLAIAVALTGAGLALRRLTPSEEKGK